MKANIISLVGIVSLLGVFVAPAVLAGDANELCDSDAWVPVRHLQFTDEDIQGGIADPDGVLIEAVPPATHSSLIEIRQGFEVELVKTLEDF